MAEYIPVYTASGQLQAETIRLFLESFNVPAKVLQESVGTVYGLTVGPLGQTTILVPEEQAQIALELLAKMEKGDFETDESEEDITTSDENAAGE